MRSSIAFARHPDALAVARARLDSDLKWFGFRHRALTVASGAGSQVLSSPMAAWTLDIELHSAAGLSDLSCAIAFRTLARSFQRTLPVALRANVLSGDIEAHDAAADRRPEGNVHLVFEVGAGLRALGLRSSATAPAEHRTEDVAEASTSARAFLTADGVVHQVGEVESTEIEVDSALPARLSSAGISTRKSAKSARASGSPPGVGFGGRRVDVVGIKSDLIVNLPLLGVAENIVGFRDRLKLLFSGLIPGIDVRMVF